MCKRIKGKRLITIMAAAASLALPAVCMAEEQAALPAAGYYYYYANRSAYSGVAADKSSQKTVRKVLLTDETRRCIEALDTLHEGEILARELVAEGGAGNRREEKAGNGTAANKMIAGDTVRKKSDAVSEKKTEEDNREKTGIRTGEKAENTIEVIGNWEPSLREKLSLTSLLRETEKAGCHIGLVMIDIRTGQGIAVNPAKKFYSASSVKGPFVISLAALYPRTLERQKNAFKAVAVNSDNGAYSSLVSVYGKKYYTAWCEAVGVDAPLNQGDYASMSAEDLARLWLLDYQYITGNPTYGEELGELFETPNRSAIHPVLENTFRTQTKGGWIAMRSRTSADAGIVYAGENPYILALISDYPANLGKLEPYVALLDSMHRGIADEISSCNK